MMHIIEQPHDDLPVVPSDVWDNLSLEQQESAILLLTKLAFELVTARREEQISDGNDEQSSSNK
jgi:hypothetical protein